MNESVMWFWLVPGFVPYHIEKKCLTRGRRLLVVRALFWSLTVQSTGWGRSRTWKLRVPLIERLRDAIWAAVDRLRQGQ
jgi:hypothetical protein